MLYIKTLILFVNLLFNQTRYVSFIVVYQYISGGYWYRQLLQWLGKGGKTREGDIFQ